MYIVDVRVRGHCEVVRKLIEGRRTFILGGG